MKTSYVQFAAKPSTFSFEIQSGRSDSVPYDLPFCCSLTVRFLDAIRWDEKGRYDVPATIKYVLSFTGQEKLVFIGGSLGATVFFIAMIQQPELNAKIDRMFALGPTSSRRYSKSVYRHMVPYFPRIHVSGPIKSDTRCQSFSLLTQFGATDRFLGEIF